MHGQKRLGAKPISHGVFADCSGAVALFPHLPGLNAATRRGSAYDILRMDNNPASPRNIVNDPGASKLDHLQPFKPILF